MQNENKGNRKYVFVCGLQRSGTTVLARNVAKLEGCTGFEHTGFYKDEGQYLQDVYPVDEAYGGTGKHGFDPRAHLTEDSHLLTLESIARLRRSWHAHWNAQKPTCVEKTPSNLIKTRFLQAAFPNAYFIVLRRHPVAVSLATQKWTMTTLHSLFEHWLICHQWFDEDKRYLKHLYELSYEDYIQAPRKYHEELAAFIGTNAPRDGMEEISGVHNQRYLERWSNLLTNSPWKPYYLYIASKYEPKFAKYNYFLTKRLDANVKQFGGTTESMAARVGLLYCLGADVGTFFWRLHGRKMETMTRPITSLLPRALKDRMKHALQRKHLHWVARLVAPHWFIGIRKDARY
jgi:Sulfotransferase family